MLYIVDDYIVTQSMAVNFFGDSSNEQKNLHAAKATIDNYAVDISIIIQGIWSTGGLTEEDKFRLYSLIDVQIEADQVILAYDMTGLDGYERLHIGLQNLCRDDIAVLQQIKAVIEAGPLPSQELQINYASLRAKITSGFRTRSHGRFIKLAAKLAIGV